MTGRGERMRASGPVERELGTPDFPVAQVRENRAILIVAARKVINPLAERTSEESQRRGQSLCGAKECVKEGEKRILHDEQHMQEGERVGHLKWIVPSSKYFRRTLTLPGWPGPTFRCR